MMFAASSRATPRISRGRPSSVRRGGATAAQSLFGRSARVGKLRRQILHLEHGEPALVTIHPSAVLRAGDQRKERRAELRADLALARKTLTSLAA